MYFPRTWEFGSALSKLRNFGGGGGLKPQHPPRYATVHRPFLAALPPPAVMAASLTQGTVFHCIRDICWSLCKLFIGTRHIYHRNNSNFHELRTTLRYRVCQRTVSRLNCDERISGHLKFPTEVYTPIRHRCKYVHLRPLTITAICQTVRISNYVLWKSRTYVRVVSQPVLNYLLFYMVYISK
jgi:hypothetical protein